MKKKKKKKKKKTKMVQLSEKRSNGGILCVAVIQAKGVAVVGKKTGAQRPSS